ncbi:Slit 2 protein [Chionoecetes opilio]|uniref:Slit 2 protein n=1 Tax=Chionoecetes opilio TaxID=41210 RepID=A0A8J5CWB1_CHIOP|nr:Slit 2 protein [Chionoecetes opilio]
MTPRVHLYPGLQDPRGNESNATSTIPKQDPRDAAMRASGGAHAASSTSVLATCSQPVLPTLSGHNSSQLARQPSTRTSRPLKGDADLLLLPPDTVWAATRGWEGLGNGLSSRPPETSERNAEKSFVVLFNFVSLVNNHVLPPPRLLNNNHITRLHNTSFAGLDSLRYLYLYKNRIRTIEKNVFKNLNNLEQL